MVKNIMLFLFTLSLLFLLSNGTTAATPECDVLNGIPSNPNDPACYETQNTSCKWVLRGDMCELWENACVPEGRWHTVEVPIGTNCSKYKETITCRDSSGVKHWISGPWVKYGGKIYVNSCDADEIWCTNWGNFPPLSPISKNECHYTTVKTWGVCNPTTGVQVATSVNQLSVAGTSCNNDPTVRLCTVDGSCGTRDNIYESAVTTWSAGSKYCLAGLESNKPLFPSAGSTVKWSCNGLNNGKDVSCEASRNIGTCGTRNGKSYVSTINSWPSTDTLCADGIPSSANVAFPSEGSSAYWNCSGANCSAYHQSPIAPTLDFTGDPILLPSSGGIAKLKWVTKGATSCWAQNPSRWRDWKTSTGGEQNFFIDSTTVFDLECWNSAGVSTGRKYVTVTVAPAVKNNGSCGSNSRVYSAAETSFGTEWCSSGTVSFKNGVAPIFPNYGQVSNSWDCLGSGGGTDAIGCEASRKLPAPSVDLKINGSNTTVTVNRDNGGDLDFSWNVVKNTSLSGINTYCNKSGLTWGIGQIIPPKNLIDSENNFLSPGAPYPRTNIPYSLTCHNENGNAELNSPDVSDMVGVTVTCNVGNTYSGCPNKCGLPSETESCTHTNVNCTTSSCLSRNCNYAPCPISSDWVEVQP